MNVALVEQKLAVVSEVVGVASYDFDFDLHFACTHPYQFEETTLCALRIGAVVDYESEFEKHASIGLRLVNSLSEHVLAGELESWYPVIESVTPRSKVFQALPSTEEIEADFQWPIFLKGSRQTSKHNPALSLVKDRAHYKQVALQYRNDPILHWQKPVVREFVRLAPVNGIVPDKVRPSVEYRTFWWFGKCVGWGPYWYQVKDYGVMDVESGIDVARWAAAMLKVPFLVVDIALTAGGQWIVIECNDAQESGYTGVPPFEMWRQILDGCKHPG